MSKNKQSSEWLLLMPTLTLLRLHACTRISFATLLALRVPLVSACTNVPTRCLKLFGRACLPHILCSVTLFWGSFWLRDPFALRICSGPIAGSRPGTKSLREAVRTETLLATATRVNTEDINNHRRQTIDGHLSDRNHGAVQPGFSKSGIRMQQMCLLAAQNIEHMLCEYRSLVLPGGHPQRGQPLRRIH